LKIKKIYDGKSYTYNTETKRFLNNVTGKWVLRPRHNKGQSITRKKSKFEYYKFNYNFNFAKNDTELERIKLFLTKVKQRYQKHYKTKQSYTIFNMSFIEYGDIVFAYFSHADIKHLLGTNHKYLLDEILKTKLINKIDKINSHGYKMLIFEPNKLNSITYERKKIETKRVITSLRIYYKKIENGFGDLAPMFRSMQKFEISISKHDFIKEIKANYPSYVEECSFNDKAPSNLDEYIKNNMSTFDRIEQYNENTSIYDRMEYFSVDKFSGRFHSIFSQIPSCIRKYIIGAECRMDVQQMQLLLAAKLFKEALGTSSFFNDINCGDLYTKLKKDLKLPSRKYAKQYMFKLLFGKVWIETKNGGWFENENHLKFVELYPNEAKWLEKIKSQKNELKNQHAIFAKMLQTEEVRIFKQIWLKLLELGVQYITIHDELLFNKKDENVVLKVCHDVFRKEMKGINYRFN